MSGFSYRDNALCVGDQPLAQIAAEVGTPCYVYDLNRALENLQRLRTAFPQANIHYSLKANANLALVRALVESGVGLDAVSGGEIFRAIRAGADPAQIVFAGVGKTRAELEYALKARVGWINVESQGELRRVAEMSRLFKRRPQVALRLNPDVHADTHHYIDTGHAASKFGIPVAEAQSLLHDSQLNETLQIAGVHLHIGSQIGSPQRTVEALKQVLPLFKGFPSLKTLDLGGGFPVSYTGDSVPSVEDFAGAILPLLNGLAIQLLLEPGRYLIADAGVLLIEVQYLKPVLGSSELEVIAVTDGGMTELIRPALYGAYHGVLPMKLPPEGSPRIATQVVGPVCESADVLNQRVMLPPLLEGEVLAVLHAGAYGAVMGSTYNARPRPPEVLVEGGNWRVVRRRESWSDLIELENGLDP